MGDAEPIPVITFCAGKHRESIGQLLGGELLTLLAFAGWVIVFVVHMDF
jgi:hypothetical protein